MIQRTPGRSASITAKTRSLISPMALIRPAADQPRSLLLQRQASQFHERRLIRRPGALCQAQGAGDADDILSLPRRRPLLVGNLIGDVVHDHVTWIESRNIVTICLIQVRQQEWNRR